MLPSAEDWFSAIDNRDCAVVKQNIQTYGKTLDKEGQTGLMHAVENNDLEMVKVLAYTEHSLKNRDGLTAIMLAARSNRGDICKRLISYEMSTRDPEGRTALMYAAMHNAIDAVIYLLPYQKTLQDNRGRTALMYAAENNHLEVVKYLAIREREITSDDGETALIIAANAGNADVVHYLKQFEGKACPEATSQSLQNLSMNLTASYDRQAPGTGADEFARNVSYIDTMRAGGASAFTGSSKTQLERDLEAKILTLEEKLKTLHDESSTVYSNNVILEDQIKRLKQTIVDYKRQIDALQAAAADNLVASQALSVQDAGRSNLQLSGFASPEEGTRDDLLRQLTDEQERSQKLEEALKRSHGEEGEMERKLEEERRRNAELQRLLDELNGSQIGGAVDRLQEELAAKQCEIDRLNRIISSQASPVIGGGDGERVRALEEELRATVQRLRESEDELAALRGAASPDEALLRKVEDQEREIAELRRKVRSQEQEIAELSALLHNACDEAEARRLREENSLLRAKVARGPSEQEAGLLRELDRLRAVIIEQGAALARTDGEAARLRQTVDDLSERLSGAAPGTDTRALEEELAAARAEISRLHAIAIQEGNEGDRLQALEGEVRFLTQTLIHRDDTIRKLKAELEAVPNVASKPEVATEGLDEKVRARDQEIERLRDALTRALDGEDEAPDYELEKVLRGMISRLEDQVRDRDREITELREARAVADAASSGSNKVAALMLDISTLQSHNRFLEQSIADKQEEVNRLMQQLQEGQTADILKRLKDAEAELDTLRRDLLDTCVKLETANAAAPNYEPPTTDNLIERLQEDIEMLKREMATRSDAIGRLQGRVAPTDELDSDDSENRALRDLINKASECDPSELLLKIADLEEQVEELQDELEGRDEEVARLAEAIMHQQRSFMHLREAAIARQSNVAALNTIVDTVQSLPSVANSATSAATESLHRAEIDSFSQQLLAKTREADELARINEFNGERIAAMGQDLDTLKEDVADKRSELEALRIQLRARERRIEQLKALASRSVDAEALERENERLRGLIDYEKIALLQKEIDEDVNKVAAHTLSKQEELDSLRQAAFRTEQPNEKADEYQRLLQEKEREIQKLRDQLKGHYSAGGSSDAAKATPDQADDYEELLIKRAAEIERLRALLYRSLDDESSEIQRSLSEMDRAELNRKEERIRELERYAESLSQSLANADVDQLRSQIGKLEDQVNKLHRSIKEKDERLALIPMNADELNERLQKANDQVQELQQKYEDACNDRNELRERLRRLQAEQPEGIGSEAKSITDLYRQLQDVKNENLRLTESITEMSRKEATAMQSMGQAVSELEDLEKVYQKHIKEIRDNYGSVDDVLDGDSSNKSKVMALTNKLRALEMNLASERERVNGININNDVLRKKIDALEREIQSPDALSPRGQESPTRRHANAQGTDGVM
ncbi:Ankyrin repeat protein 1 [Giardia muris]|uniref:Ankyrin repeat protein 1 n=1 Tax=Giardia muris TaxID=5742 RepID=A0A4Z1SUK7_GIAMU|nr:Ankyrin repeat protein 1 [Giardia muris]|eukprot:TNJ27288.1 Ankyrin repeat protein 1 [Giardia muris]